MTEVTMEEMEAQVAAPVIKGSDIKLDASDLPDFAKGKTAADLAEEVSRARQALKISEDARLALSESVRNRDAAPAPVAPLPTNTGPKELTREELKELMQEDPMQVMDYMATHMTHRLGTHLDSRFAPIVQSTIGSAEAQAKAKYKDEFELFGSQIAQLKTKVNPQILGTSQGWDEMIAYVRGLPENFDKLIERRTSRPAPEARAEQVRDVGFTPRIVSSTPVPVASGREVKTVADLDATQLEICRTMNLTPEEYLKYM